PRKENADKTELSRAGEFLQFFHKVQKSKLDRSAPDLPFLIYGQLLEDEAYRERRHWPCILASRKRHAHDFAQLNYISRRVESLGRCGLDWWHQSYRRS